MGTWGRLVVHSGRRVSSPGTGPPVRQVGTEVITAGPRARRATNAAVGDIGERQNDSRPVDADMVEPGVNGGLPMPLQRGPVRAGGHDELSRLEVVRAHEQQPLVGKDV